MVQEIIVWLLFALAIGYLGRLVYSSFAAKGGGCSKGCGSCSSLDPAKLEALIKKTENQHKA